MVNGFIMTDNSTLNKLFKEHIEDINKFIYSKVKDIHLTKDLSQETLIKLTKALRKKNYEDQGKFKSFALCVANNIIVDYYRKKKRRPKMKRSETYDIFSKIKYEELNKEEYIIKEQMLKEVKQLLNKIPKKLRQVLILRFYNKMTFRQIAKETNTKINTVQGRFRYGMDRLKQLHGLNELLNR
mgnify:CR=1 FL=1